MGTARFGVTVLPAGHGQLLDGDRVLLSGEAASLQAFALWLNRDPPRTAEDLRLRLQEMMQVTRGGGFAIGPALKHANTQPGDV